MEKIDKKDVTRANQAEYTSQVAERLNDASRPYEATIKLLKNYYSVRPKEVEAAITLIRDCIDAEFQKSESGLIK